MLGVRPFINCCSVRTMHGGSLMLPQVRDAMAEASRHFVNLDELMEAAGQRLAELTGAEWGIVTCGSAAAVALGTAACVAGNDPVKMLRLPFTDGMVNRVIIPKTQRFSYDQAVRMIGCHLVEIETREDLDRALAEPVAMVVVLGKLEHLGSLRLEEIAAVVKPRGIPIMVDAASEHLERPSPWLVRGADLVVYSGGKFLRGPQTSGLLLGSKQLVQAAWSNASPHQALGRPMKVSKEDIIGVLTAVEHWFEERDHEAEQQQWYDDLEAIGRAGRRSARRRLCELIEPPASTGCRGCASPGTAGNTRSTGWRCVSKCSTASRASCSTTTRRPKTRSRSTRSNCSPARRRRSATRSRRCCARPAGTRRRRLGRPRAKSPATGNCASIFCRARASTGSTSSSAAPNSPAISDRPISRARSAAG